MAFPSVDATATSTDLSDVTTHTITMPSGIVSGDELVAFLQIGTVTGEDFGWPAGWTVIKRNNADSREHEVAVKTSDGTEGASIDVTTTVSTKSSHLAYRISGAAGNAVISTGATAASDSPDSDSLTPSWGSANTLWLSIVAARFRTATALPASYTNEVSSGPASGTAGVHSCRRETATATEDPGVWTLDGSITWYAYTLALEPTASAAGSVSSSASGGRRGMNHGRGGRRGGGR